jgi:hypothetical protein
MVVSTCNPSYSRGRGRWIMSSRLAWAKLVKPCLKNKNKRAKDIVQVVESAWESALPSTTQPQ